MKVLLAHFPFLAEMKPPFCYTAFDLDAFWSASLNPRGQSLVFFYRFTSKRYSLKKTAQTGAKRCFAWAL